MKRAWVIALAVVAGGLAYDPSTEAAEPKRVLALLFACVALALLAVQRVAAARKLRHPVSWSSRAALACVALSALSFAWGRPLGVLDLGTWMGAVGVGLYVRGLRRLEAVAVARISGLWLGGLSALVTLGSALHGARGFALHGGQGNPNWLGLLFAITLPLSLDVVAIRLQRGWGRPHAADRLADRTSSGSVRSSRGSVRKLGVGGVLAFGLTVLQLPALYLAHSRVAWAALAVACIVHACLVLARRGTVLRRVLPPVVLTMFLALLALGAIAGTAYAGSPDADAESGAQEDAPVVQSFEGRVWIWRASLAAAKNAAPFGVGLGNFGFAFHDAQAARLAPLTPGVASRRYENATTAHQEYLQVAIESGPLAALALLLALVLGARAHARAKCAGGLGALVACAVTCLGDSPLRQPAIVLIVALCIAAARDGSVRRKGTVTLRRVALITLLGGATLCLASATRAWLGTRALTASFESSPEARLVLLDKAVKVDPTSGELHLARGLFLLGADDPAAALVDLQTARTLIADVGAQVASGHAELALGRPEDAGRSYRDALAWHPGSLRARVGLAESLRQRGKLGEAEDEARIARKLSPGSARVRDLIDAISEAKSDEDHE